MRRQPGETWLQFAMRLEKNKQATRQHGESLLAFAKRIEREGEEGIRDVIARAAENIPADPSWSPDEPPATPRLQKAPQWVEDLITDPSKFEVLIKNLVKQALQVVTGRLNTQEGQLNRLQGGAVAHTQSIDRHERELSSLNRGLNVQANDLGKHDQRLARLEEQAKRAETLEIKIAALEAQNEALAARLKDLSQASVQDVQQQLDDHLYYEHGVSNATDERYRDLATTVPGGTHRPAPEA